jgi:hypothetical protein
MIICKMHKMHNMLQDIKKISVSNVMYIRLFAGEKYTFSNSNIIRLVQQPHVQKIKCLCVLLLTVNFYYLYYFITMEYLFLLMKYHTI